MLFSWLNIRLYITLILVSTLFFSATKKNMFRPVFLSEINFNDNNEIYITKDSVKNYLDMIVDSMGISLNSNYLNLFEKKLQTNKLIKAPQLFITPNSKLIINVHQKIPIARFADNTRYLDYDGNIMPKSKIYSANVPIIFGANDFSEIKSFHKILKFINNDDFLKNIVSKIELNDLNKFSIKIYGLDAQINIGTADNLVTKISNFKAFYNKASNDKTINKYKLINLQFENQVVCVNK